MAKKIPAFGYTGQYRTQSDDNYWYILLLTSGTLTFSYAKSAIDVACVGGGGSSACHLQYGNDAGGSGGGGSGVAVGAAAVAAGQGYAVNIGAGGAVPAVWNPGNDGGATTALGVSAEGGKGAGGGGAGGTGGYPGVDGTDGNAGAANTGGGAGGPGGGYADSDSRYNGKGGQAAAGGSGIVILRGTQDDLIPVVFNGVQLSALYLNGVKITSLIYGGVQVFMRKLKRRRGACFV